VISDHASAAGALCTDDGTGCCSTCGVSLDVCEQCSGVGYHQAGCSEVEVTDQQISKLWTDACGSNLRDVDPDAMHDCTVALNHHGDFSAVEVSDARARVATVINDRAKVKGGAQ
jgi:hypothetical protein